MAVYHYYVNDVAQANGDHEVHRDGCQFMPSEQNRTYLGYFDNCAQAVREAAKHHRRVNGCYHCSFPCHTS
jgi:hypothetical protein